MPETKRPLKVFLCHARADKQKVRELYRTLRKRGIQPWLDAEDLVAGQDWRIEIPKAIRASDAIVICLSRNSINKEGFVQTEIAFALEKALEIPPGRIFIIPARFEDCEVPDRLERFQWVDLFEEGGFRRLMRSLRTRAGQLERATVQVPEPHETSPNLSPAPEAEDHETTAKVEREKAREEAERKAAETEEQEKTEEAARQKIEREAVEKDSKEKAEREATEKAAREKARRELAEKAKREKAEGARKEEVERKATEKAIRDKAKREAAEKSKSEREQRRIAQIAARKEAFSKSFNSFKLTITKAKPFLRIVGIIGLIFVLFWVGSWVMSMLPLPEPTATASLTPTSESLQTEITDPKGVQMVLIPRGEFTMGGGRGFSNENPAHVVDLDAFYIDKYEVTNALYRACHEEGECQRPIYTNLYYVSTREDHPVVAVDWNMANAYCQWRGARLPTEAEWEKAARGEDERTYPWGAVLSLTYANYNGNSTKAVGSYLFVKSPYGVYDMAGNVSEWVSDWYSPDYYQTIVDKNNPNPTGPARSPFDDSHPSYGRVFRGGSWKTTNSYELSTTYRSREKPDSYADHLGFRCVMPAKP